MPSGFTNSLTRDELRDLIRFLVEQESSQEAGVEE